MVILSYFVSAANSASYHDPKSMPEAKPEVKKPEFVISGGPSIKQCEILNDKRHILTKDTENNVSLYDVLKARKVEDLGQVEFEQEVKKRLQVSIKRSSHNPHNQRKFSQFFALAFEKLFTLAKTDIIYPKNVGA